MSRRRDNLPGETALKRVLRTGTLKVRLPGLRWPYVGFGRAAGRHAGRLDFAARAVATPRRLFPVEDS
jgi:hypothetical protein